MIFVTGDTHIPIDIKKLNSQKFPIQKDLTRSDIVIVLGDFGLLWKEDKEYLYWKRWLEKKKFTIAWLDGNHENFDWIDRLPVSEWNGGRVHRCGENILHLMRGEVYTIEEKRFFVCGGATSTDQEFRKPYVSWWPIENVTNKEIEHALDNLDRNGPVDFVLTHTCPEAVAAQMFQSGPLWDGTAKFLDDVAERLPDVPWYFGHWHEDKDWGRYHVLYNRVLRIV